MVPQVARRAREAQQRQAWPPGMGRPRRDVMAEESNDKQTNFGEIAVCSTIFIGYFILCGALIGYNRLNLYSFFLFSLMVCFISTSHMCWKLSKNKKEY